MASVDAAGLADKMVRLKVISLDCLPEVWEEIGGKKAEPEALLRCLERKGLITPFQTSKLLKGDTDGYFLGGYRLLYKIASGTFGRVFRADDPNTGRVVAIKILRTRWEKDQHKVELFVREGKMGMSLRHPNIVEILAVNHDRVSNQHYMVMEFVEGGNLRDFVIRRKLMPAEVLRILEEVTSGLEYGASRGVTHRDMKLTNVLLSSQGTAKLVDFGLAGGSLGFEEKDDASVERTVDYAGLEQATGAPRDDPRSDLFFLGCIAYELLTGRPPMERKRMGPQQRMQAQRFLNIVPMRPDEVQAPLSVFRLVEQMMALNPNERFQTPSQLLARTREVRAELEGHAKGGAKSQHTIFIAERDEGLQDLLRTKLKEHGFRVLIAADPVRALDRFRQSPFDLLIVDAITTGENGFYVFERIMDDAHRQNIPCNGILMLSSEQETWKNKIANKNGITFLTYPVKYKQLLGAINTLLPGSV